ncbi:DedA family protein [Nocardioides litoris]|uniref:DedA family protein n=1 Tax=Nocardioides litoris TaxID=1926648 RepID=UPI0011224280|nr:VTT domain-containing protein [Nocardioides litoris]
MNADLGLAGLAALFGVVAFGAVVPVVPTGAAVSAAAVLARAEQPWELVLVVLVGGAGAWVGDVITYAVLRLAGRPLAQRIGWLGADDPDGALQHLRARLEADEVRSLLLSRLVPGGRVPVLLAAALGGYPVARFASADVAAALLWAGVYATVGIVGDALIPDPMVALVVVVVAAVVLGLVVPRLGRLVRVRRARPEGTG